MIKKVLLFCFLLNSFPSIAQTAEEIDSLGMDYFFKGVMTLNTKPDSCIIYLTEAIPLFKNAENWNFYVNCYNGLFAVYNGKRDFKRAEINAVKAFELSKQYLDKSDDAYFTAQNNLGVLYDLKGDFNRALDAYEKTLHLIKISTNQKDSKAKTNFNISNIYYQQGDYEAAILHLEESLQLFQDTFGMGDYNVGRMFFHLARAYQKKGELDQAKSYFQNSQSNLENQKEPKSKRVIRQLINVYQRFGQFYLVKNQPDSTIFFVNKALVFQQKLNPDPYRNYLSYEILGEVNQQSQNYSKAIDFYSISLERAKSELEFESHRVFGRLHYHLGSCYAAQKQWAKALQFYQKGLEQISVKFNSTSTSQNPEPESFLDYFEGLKLLEAKGNSLWSIYQVNPNNQEAIMESFAAFEAADKLIQYTRNNLFTQESKQLLAEKAVSIYEMGTQVALNLNEKTKNSDYLIAAFEFSERTKSILLIEALNSDKIKYDGLVPDSLREKERQLQIELASYERQITENQIGKKKKDRELIEEYQVERRRIIKVQQELAQQIERDFPRYNELRKEEIINSVQEIQNSILDEQAALIEFSIGKNYIFIFLITKDSLVHFSSEKPESFDSTVIQLREIIRNPPSSQRVTQSFQEYKYSSYQLYQWLLQDALYQVPAAVNKLIIVPDGKLNLVPFEILLQEEPKSSLRLFDSSLSYLFKDFQISYSYSASLLTKSKNDHSSSKAEKLFLGLAPSFSSQAIAENRDCLGETLYSLQCSQNEVQQIQDLIGGEILIGEAADKAAFNTQGENYRVLHLATHACPDLEEPMLSRIHFTDDYLLNYDLMNLNLDADLVVLSACNTGVGKIIPGEGVMSLSKGFIWAGTPSTVLSLWAVDDCVTSDLMTSFYQNLKNGLTKDAALQATRLQFVQEADKRFQHPYYWAPFILMGDAEAVNFVGASSQLNVYYLIGFMTLFLIIGLIIYFVVKKTDKNS